MRGYLLAIILCLISQTYTLFNTTYSAKFSSSSLQNPHRLIVDASGTKFITWNNMSKYQIFWINGTNKCSGSTSWPIARVLWPKNYNPIILLFPGKNIVRLEDEYCTQIKTYNFTDEVHEMAFVWRNNLPILLTSNWKSTFQQFNLNTSSSIKSYLSTAIILDKAMTALYNGDGSYFFGFQIASGNRRLQIYDTSIGMGFKSLQSDYSLTGFTLMKNGKDILCLATSSKGTETNVIKLTSDLNAQTVVERQQINKLLGMSEDNHIVLFKTISTELQLINTKDGSSKQFVQYFDKNSTYIIDADYKNKSIVLLDDKGNFITAGYEPTPEPDPIPIVPDNFPVWAIVVIAVGGALVVAIGLLFLLRNKLSKKLRYKLQFWKRKNNKQGSLLYSQHQQQMAIQEQKSQKSIRKNEGPIRRNKQKQNEVSNKNKNNNQVVDLNQSQNKYFNPQVRESANQHPQPSDAVNSYINDNLSDSDTGSLTVSGYQSFIVRNQPASEVIPDDVPDNVRMAIQQQKLQAQRIQRQYKQKRQLLLRQHHLEKERIKKQQKERQQQQKRYLQQLKRQEQENKRKEKQKKQKQKADLDSWYRQKKQQQILKRQGYSKVKPNAKHSSQLQQEQEQHYYDERNNLISQRNNLINHEQESYRNNNNQRNDEKYDQKPQFVKRQFPPK